jgi:hypothetical protein
MLRKIHRLTFVLISLVLSAAIIVQAQAECNVDSADVIAIVEDVCSDLGQNQVCYGNFEVSAIAQENSPAFVFEQAGDFANLGYVRSLFLSALNPETESWGIAQMRMVANTSTGTQRIDMLLFGNVEITSNVPAATEMAALVGQYAANIRNTPNANALILASAPSGSALTAVGRLADSSWVRVLIAETGAVGWVSTSLISPSNAAESFDSLAVQDGSSPYFGAMQAFYFTDNGGSGCGNIAADGILIQTPEGTARVTLLVNEVSIELIPNENGATALITGNAEDGMTVSVIDGEAIVEVNGDGYYVDSSQETTVPLNPDLSPSGQPSTPSDYDVDEMIELPVLPIIRESNAPIVRTGGRANGSNGGSGSGNGNGNGNGSGTGNGNGNGNGNANGNGNSNGNRNGNGNGN